MREKKREFWAVKLRYEDAWRTIHPYRENCRLHEPAWSADVSMRREFFSREEAQACRDVAAVSAKVVKVTVYSVKKVNPKEPEIRVGDVYEWTDAQKASMFDALVGDTVTVTGFTGNVVDIDRIIHDEDAWIKSHLQGFISSGALRLVAEED